MWRNILVGALWCCVVLGPFLPKATGKTMTLRADPWDNLPRPELGVRTTNDEPIGRARDYVWVRMPQVKPIQPTPGYSNVFDLECYECPRDLKLLGHRVLESGVLELRHRRTSRPHVVVVSEFTPRPGMVQILVRVQADSEKSAEKIVPDDLPHLNMCPSLVRARGSFVRYAAYPDPFPEVINRCFIFTDKGQTFLNQTVRRNMPRLADDDPRNNPPWIQVYRPVWEPVREPSTGDTFYNNSPDRFTVPILGVVSMDGKHLIALANDSADRVCQAWSPCLHNNPEWMPTEAPPAQRRWHVNLYIMPNDPDMLLERVVQDFPDLFKRQENRVPASP